MAEEENRGKKVMVAIDESDCSQYALEWTLQNLNESLLKKRVLLLFTVQSISDYSYLHASTFGTTYRGREIGDPKDAICEVVEKYKVELLVLGSHSRGALKRVFLGSVSNYCVHNAKCRVLVVRKPL